MESVTTYISVCGYYMLQQHNGYWVEYYKNIQDGWTLQEDSLMEAKNIGLPFNDFNNTDEGAITYIKPAV